MTQLVHATASLAAVTNRASSIIAQCRFKELQAFDGNMAPIISFFAVIIVFNRVSGQGISSACDRPSNWRLFGATPAVLPHPIYGHPSSYIAQLLKYTPSAFNCNFRIAPGGFFYHKKLFLCCVFRSKQKTTTVNKLMKDVGDSLIYAVIVYRIDRLSRPLSDFTNQLVNADNDHSLRR